MQRQGRLLRSMARWFSVVPPSNSFVSVADIRCTYSFDEKRSPTGQINYDRAGNVLSKSSLEYREDSVGNGLEKKVFILGYEKRTAARETSPHQLANNHILLVQSVRITSGRSGGSRAPHNPLYRGDSEAESSKIECKEHPRHPFLEPPYKPVLSHFDDEDCNSTGRQHSALGINRTLGLRNLVLRRSRAAWERSAGAG